MQPRFDFWYDHLALWEYNNHISEYICEMANDNGGNTSYNRDKSNGSILTIWNKQVLT